MNNSYQKFISKSLEKLIWFLLLGTFLSLISRVVIFILQINYIVKAKSNHSFISMDPSHTIFHIVIPLIIVILWAFIKINLNQQNKSTSTFLHSLLKNILLISVFSFIIFIPNILYYYISNWDYQQLRYLISDLPKYAWQLIIITFLIIVVRSYSKTISYTSLKVFKRTALIIFIINSIYTIVIIFKSLNTFLYKDDFFFFYNLDNNIQTVISLFMSIIWILWIYKYELIYKNFTTNNEILIENEESPIFNVNQKCINYSLKKYGIIGFFTGAITLRIAFIIYQFIQLINMSNTTINTKVVRSLILNLLSNPNIFTIFIEMFIYFWIIFLVLFNSKKHTLTPFLTLLIISFYTLFQIIILFIYIKVLYSDVLYIMIKYSSYLYNQLIQLLCLIIFIYMIISRYRVLIKPLIVKIVCTGFIIISIVNYIFSLININKLYINMTFSLIDLKNNNTSIIFITVVNSIIFVFWVLFALFYCIKLCQEYNNDEL